MGLRAKPAVGDGKLLFFHAVPLDELSLAKVKAWGTPAYLVIAHDQHGVDADAFQKKLGLKLYGPQRSAEKMRKKLDLDGTFDALPRDPAYELVPVAGVKHGEPAILVHSAGGTSAVFSDAYMNIRTGGFLMRLTGFIGADRCPPLFRLRFVEDKRALKGFFEKLAATPRLQHLVPCHGDVRSERAGETLAQLAARL